MKYFQMRGAVNDELLDKFTDFYNSNIDQKITIIVNTGGGDLKAAQIIIMIINSHKDVTLLIHSAFSAGMIICVNSECPKILSKYSTGMWHYGKWTVDVTDNTGYYNEDKAMIKNFPLHKKSSDLFAKKIMTDKEFKNFKKEKDIYFNLKRMKQIFPEAKIL